MSGKCDGYTAASDVSAFAAASRPTQETEEKLSSRLQLMTVDEQSKKKIISECHFSQSKSNFTRVKHVKCDASSIIFGFLSECTKLQDAVKTLLSEIRNYDLKS